MKGWKTWLAVICSIVFGLLGLYLDLIGPAESAAFITAGLGLLGLGGKLDRAQPVLVDVLALIKDYQHKKEAQNPPTGVGASPPGVVNPADPDSADWHH